MCWGSQSGLKIAEEVMKFPLILSQPDKSTVIEILQPLWLWGWPPLLLRCWACHSPTRGRQTPAKEQGRRGLHLSEVCDDVFLDHLVFLLLLVG
mmetsp:Transcript_4179/g.9341  ORF Transcript_4179/g.9341 Transcript_4179/m.9341 type:complete len:94 (+) Transcript_4179:66-347(+)